MRWIIGVAVALGCVVAANGVLIWLAVHGAEPLDPTYVSEAR